MDEMYYRGYVACLKDIREKLNNSRENGGGIHFGKDFLEDAHWGFEIEDQLKELEDYIEN